MEYGRPNKAEQEILELTRENNRLLRKMRRSQVWGRVLTLLWWAIIIGVPVALYYFLLQPYVESISVTYETVAKDLGGVPIVDLLSRLTEFLSNFGVGETATSTPL